MKGVIMSKDILQTVFGVDSTEIKQLLINQYNREKNTELDKDSLSSFPSPLVTYDLLYACISPKGFLYTWNIKDYDSFLSKRLNGKFSALESDSEADSEAIRNCKSENVS